MSSSPELAALVDEFLATVPASPELAELMEAIVGQLRREAEAAAAQADEREADPRTRDVDGAAAAGYTAAVRDQLRAEAERWAGLAQVLRDGPLVVVDDPDSYSYVKPDEGNRA